MNERSKEVAQVLRASRSIQEFRIDFFLEEEFSYDPQFADRFASECGFYFETLEVERVALQPKLDRSGFGDIFVILIARENSGNLRRLALLIENKINAGAQPQRAARYRRCGEHGLGKEWDDYRTVLVAPESYVGERSGFQAFVSLESISDLICSAEPVRAEFRRRKLTEAIAKKNATGVQIIDPVMTSFRAAYHLYLEDFNARHGTNFWTNSPRPTYDGDTWVILKSDALPLEPVPKFAVTAFRLPERSLQSGSDASLLAQIQAPNRPKHLPVALVLNFGTGS